MIPNQTTNIKDIFSHLAYKTKKFKKSVKSMNIYNPLHSKYDHSQVERFKKNLSRGRRLYKMSKSTKHGRNKPQINQTQSFGRNKLNMSMRPNYNSMTLKSKTGGQSNGLMASSIVDEFFKPIDEPLFTQKSQISRNSGETGKMTKLSMNNRSMATQNLKTMELSVSPRSHLAVHNSRNIQIEYLEDMERKFKEKSSRSKKTNVYPHKGSLRDSQISKLSLLDKPVAQLIQTITDNPEKYHIQDLDLETSSERSRLNYDPEPKPERVHFTTPITDFVDQSKDSKVHNTRINNISTISGQQWIRVDQRKMKTSDFSLVHKADKMGQNSTNSVKNQVIKHKIAVKNLTNGLKKKTQKRRRRNSTDMRFKMKEHLTSKNVKSYGIFPNKKGVSKVRGSVVISRNGDSIQENMHMVKNHRLNQKEKRKAPIYEETLYTQILEIVGMRKKEEELELEEKMQEEIDNVNWDKIGPKKYRHVKPKIDTNAPKKRRKSIANAQNIKQQPIRTTKKTNPKAHGQSYQKKTGRRRQSLANNRRATKKKSTVKKMHRRRKSQTYIQQTFNNSSNYIALENYKQTQSQLGLNESGIELEDIPSMIRRNKNSSSNRIESFKKTNSLLKSQNFYQSKKFKNKLNASGALRNNYIFGKSDGMDGEEDLIMLSKEDRQYEKQFKKNVNDNLKKSYSNFNGSKNKFYASNGYKSKENNMNYANEGYRHEIYDSKNLNLSKSSLGLDADELNYTNMIKARGQSTKQPKLNFRKSLLYRYERKENKSYNQIFSKKRSYSRSREYYVRQRSMTGLDISNFRQLNGLRSALNRQISCFL